MANPQGVELQPGVVEAARRGDEHAFAKVVLHFDRRLRDLAYRVLGDADSMDDAMQDAYLKAFRALGRFRDDAAIGTWLYRIVYTTCLDRAKRDGGFKLAPIDEVPELADLCSDFTSIVAEREALAQALASLSPEHRAVVLLVDQEGFDYKAASEVLGVPARTVSSRLAYARATLRRTLEDSAHRAYGLPDQGKEL